MTRPPWPAKDFEIAQDFLEEHEAEAKTSPIMDTRKEVVVILPAGLPGLGVRFHGGFMMAPLLVFMAAVLWFLWGILWTSGRFGGPQIALQNEGPAKLGTERRRVTDSRYRADVHSGLNQDWTLDTGHWTPDT